MYIYQENYLRNAMTRDEFKQLIEDELDEMIDFVYGDSQRDYAANQFYENYTKPSATAISNVFREIPEGGDDEGEGMGMNLMITALWQSKGVEDILYIVSVYSMDTLETKREVFLGWTEVIEFAAKEWFDIYYQKDKEYGWYYKDGDYSEDVIDNI